MLSLLTDAHLSPRVADQVKVKRPEMAIQSLRTWHGGEFLQSEDAVILSAALEEGLTLVTYDQRTIAPLVMQWRERARPCL